MILLVMQPRVLMLIAFLTGIAVWTLNQRVVVESFHERPTVSWASYAREVVGLSAPVPTPDDDMSVPLGVLCGASSRPLNMMPLRWSTLCTHRSYDMSLLVDNGSLAAPRDELTYCELALLHTDLCTEDESAVACIGRLGARRLELVLARRCTLSSYFQQLLAKEASLTGTSDALPPLQGHGGMILASMIDKDQPLPYVNPEHRPQGHVIPWRQSPMVPCLYNRVMMGVPEEAIVQAVERKKLFDVFPLKPLSFPIAGGANYAFGSNDEAILREAQRRSYFTVTHRRGCWSAQRHYDGLASGAIPLFVDLHLATEPDIDLPMYPHALVLAARRLGGVDQLFNGSNALGNFVDPIGFDYSGRHRVHNIVEMPELPWRQFKKSAYFALADRLLEYTRANLTTKAVATHFLRAMGNEHCRSVLVFHDYFMPEINTLMHGLASLGVTVYSPSTDQLRRRVAGTTEPEAADERERMFWRGYRSAGHLYGFRIPRAQLIQCEPDHCLGMIRQKRFDLVVYSVSSEMDAEHNLSNERLFMHYGEVRKVYAADQIAFIDGADDARSMKPVPDICTKGKVFTRERPFVTSGEAHAMKFRRERRHR